MLVPGLAALLSSGWQQDGGTSALGDEPAPSAQHDPSSFSLTWAVKSANSYSHSCLHPQKSRLTRWLHPIALGSGVKGHPDREEDPVLCPAPASAP